MSYHLAPGETLMQCPYEKSHQILNQKFSLHLSNCRENYLKQCREKGKPIDIVICRHNRSHHVHKDDIELHENHQCEDGYSILPHLQYHQSDEFKAKLAAERPAGNSNAARNGNCSGGTGVANLSSQLSSMTLTPPATPDNGDDENWDADAREGYVTGYDPKQKLANGVYLIMPSGMKPAERKAWRKENVRRAAEQGEREEEQKYGPRTGSAQQPHWRQDVGTTASSAMAAAATAGRNGSSPAPTVPVVSLPVGLTLADVTTAQGSSGKTKKKKKKKAQTSEHTLQLDRQPQMPTVAEEASSSRVPASTMVQLGHETIKEEKQAAPAAAVESDYDYDWKD